MKITDLIEKALDLQDKWNDLAVIDRDLEFQLSELPGNTSAAEEFCVLGGQVVKFDDLSVEGDKIVLKFKPGKLVE